MAADREVVHGYCTVDDLREQFGDAQTNRQLSNNLLVRAINAASRAVDNYTDRRFWADAVPTVRYVDPTYGLYDLAVPDIATTTGLLIDTDDAGDGTYTGNWAATDYRLYPLERPEGPWSVVREISGRRFAPYCPTLHRPVRPVRVTARFGWLEVPAEVEQATVIKAASIFKRKDAPLGIVQASADFPALRIGRWDNDVIELLTPYCRDIAMVG